MREHTVIVKNARVKEKCESNNIPILTNIFNNSMKILIFMRKRSVFLKSLHFFHEIFQIKNDLDFDYFFKSGSYTIVYFLIAKLWFLTALDRPCDRVFHRSLRIERSFTGITGQQNPVRLYIIILKLGKY